MWRTTWCEARSMLPSKAVRRPEHELLLCCARSSRTPETSARIEALLGEKIDWEYLISTAHMHGMAPLLYRHLDAARSEAVPEDALGRLRRHFRANGFQNLLLAGELVRLLKAFGARDLLAVPYKGPALAASVYGNLALRQFIDLDIIVHRRDVLEAKELLVSSGYRPQYRLTPAQEAALLGSRGTYVFTRDDQKSTVELHWEIVEHFSSPLRLERMQGRLGHVPLGGELVPILSPEDTLLILCGHGFKHLWERLGWVCDVAELIRGRPEMRWEQVAARAEALGGERILLLGLLLANELLGANLPDWLSQRAHGDPRVGALAERICRRLFRGASGLAGLFEGDAYFHPLHLKVKESPGDKLRYCLRATIPNVEDWKLLALPDFLFPLYYLLRPVRLGRKYGSRLLRRLLRPEEPADVHRAQRGP